MWLMIFTSLVVIYAFRFELNFVKDRVLAVLVPSYSWSNTPGQVVIARGSDGHFYLDAKNKNKYQIKFLVDTGATDVALTQEDAVKFGIDPKKLNYTQRYSTANGVAYAAPVVIDQLTIGQKTFYNIDGHVTSGGLDVSLLGMSVINKFRDFSITRDLLTLNY